MRSYDLITYEGLGPEAAKRALNIFKATVLEDAEHPFNVAQHPQHEDAVRVFAELNAATRAGDEDAAHEADEAELREALADEEPCFSREECLARAAALLRTPGYVLNTPGAMLDADRERIRKKVHALTMIAERAGAEEQRIAAEERIAAKQASAEALEADGDDGAEAW